MKINGRIKVKTLQEQFKSEFGLTLRVYDGNKFADPDFTLAKVRKGDALGGEFSPKKNMKVGNLEDKILQDFGVKVQVAGSCDSYLCDNSYSLAKALELDGKRTSRRKSNQISEESAGVSESSISIQIVGNGMELLVGEMSSDKALALAERNGNLDQEGFISIVGEWTEYNDFLHYHGPNADEFQLLYKGQEVEVEFESPDEFGLEELPSEWKIKEGGVRYILISLIIEVGTFGELVLPKDPDFEKLVLVTQAPEYGWEEFCLVTNYFYGQEEIHLQDDASETESKSVRHFVFDLQEEEVVFEL